MYEMSPFHRLVFLGVLAPEQFVDRFDCQAMWDRGEEGDDIQYHYHLVCSNLHSLKLLQELSCRIDRRDRVRVRERPELAWVAYGVAVTPTLSSAELWRNLKRLTGQCGKLAHVDAD
ncbi:unnamed protein product [Schistocephalus solidus]|uniref:Transcriptional regulator n=1 Tax=Schistocephalus solidus TaxID=70667 RepID=A0A183T6Q0_SCHSO|nr:unnamed protein product [Schistocephalus solidus]